MARGYIYGQGSRGIKVNDVLKTTAVIKTGSTINKGDLISYDGTEVIKRGININKGNEYVFNNDNISDISAVSLTSTKVLVSYTDGAGRFGNAKVLNISGSIITSGNGIFFTSNTIDYISAVSLTSTKVLVSYKDPTHYNKGTAIVLNISGNTITKGDEFIFNSDTTNHVSAVSLTSTKVLVSYNSSDNSYGTAIVLNISGDVITSGNEYIFNNIGTAYISAVYLTNTKILVSYRDNGNNSYYGTAIVLNISGDVISSGSSFVFNNDYTNNINTVSLTSTKVLVSYRDYGNNDYGTSIVLNISGNTITKGSTYVFNSDTTYYISAVKLSDTLVLVSYSDHNNNDYGNSIVLNISGSDINSGTSYIFNSDITNHVSAVSLTSTKVLVSYKDGGNSSYGTSIVLDLTKTDIEGLALSNGTGGETIDIYKF